MGIYQFDPEPDTHFRFFVNRGPEVRIPLKFDSISYRMSRSHPSNVSFCFREIPKTNLGFHRSTMFASKFKRRSPWERYKQIEILRILQSNPARLVSPKYNA